MKPYRLPFIELAACWLVLLALAGCAAPTENLQPLTVPARADYDAEEVDVYVMPTGYKLLALQESKPNGDVTNPLLSRIVLAYGPAMRPVSVAVLPLDSYSTEYFNPQVVARDDGEIYVIWQYKSKADGKIYHCWDAFYSVSDWDCQPLDTFADGSIYHPPVLATNGNRVYAAYTVTDPDGHWHLRYASLSPVGGTLDPAEFPSNSFVHVTSLAIGPNGSLFASTSVTLAGNEYTLFDLEWLPEAPNPNWHSFTVSPVPGSVSDSHIAYIPKANLIVTSHVKDQNQVVIRRYDGSITALMMVKDLLHPDQNWTIPGSAPLVPINYKLYYFMSAKSPATGADLEIFEDEIEFGDDYLTPHQSSEDSFDESVPKAATTCLDSQLCIFAGAREIEADASYADVWVGYYDYFAAEPGFVNQRIFDSLGNNNSTSYDLATGGNRVVGAWIDQFSARSNQKVVWYTENAFQSNLPVITR